MVRISKTADISTINIASGLKTRSRMEQKALDHPGYFHEYCFQQPLANFQWEMLECYMDATRDPLKYSPMLFLAPRNHGKTTIFAETVPLFRIGHNPNEQGQVVSSVDTLAKKRVKRVADCIQNSPRYRNLFGTLYPGPGSSNTWSPSGEAIEVQCDRVLGWEQSGGIDRDPTLVAFGILTSVEGGRANYQVFDDIVNTRNSQSETQRMQVKQRFQMGFSPMLFPSGIQIIIGTRYHYEDLYASLIPLLDDEKLYTDLYQIDIEKDALTPIEL